VAAQIKRLLYKHLADQTACSFSLKLPFWEGNGFMALV